MLDVANEYNPVISHFADDDVDVSSMFDGMKQCCLTHIHHIFIDSYNNYSTVYEPVSKRQYIVKTRHRAVHNDTSAKLLRLSSINHVSQLSCCKKRCLQQFSLDELKRIRLPFISKNERQK
jgi:two-component SAPR family response regulator